MRYPSAEHYSTRCPISHRPAFRTEEPLFCRCPVCGTVFVASTPQKEQSRPAVSCCGNAMEPLEICRDESLAGEHEMRFVVFGGFEKSAVRIAVDGGNHPMDPEHRIEWMYLRTFQGGQLKYLPERSRSMMQFAFADEDAYVYCDRDVCRMGREHCQFECKRGMVAYAYCSRHGLFRLPLTGESGAEK